MSKGNGSAVAVRKGGRPPRLLDAAFRETLLEPIRHGNYREIAARAAGVDPSLLSQWIKRGQQEPETIYGTFYKEIERAEAMAEIKQVTSIFQAGEREAKEAHWWLARKFPERWARREHVEHTGPGGGPIAHAAAVIVIGGDKDSYLAAMTKAVTELQDRRNGKAITHDVG